MGYFVIDKQGTGWREGILWKTIKDIANSLRRLDDYNEEEMGNLTHSEVCWLWDFEVHRITPRNCEKYGIRPSELKTGEEI
jgi:hypothetical protein